MYKKLFEPVSIGLLKLKNRVVFTPTESLFASASGEVTQRVIDYYVRRAEGGAGLLVVHSAQACTKLDPVDPYPGSLRVDDNAYIPMLSELTDAVHQAGAKISINVSAGGGAQAMGFPYDRGMEGIETIINVAPGNVKSRVANRPVRKLKIDEIKRMVELFGFAARRIELSGFDAMTIHAYFGYLICQFLSRYYNNRTDEYGGSIENRLRFLLEIIDACRCNTSAGFPLIVRISIDECFDDGRDAKEGLEIIKRLEQAEVQAIDASAGTMDSVHMSIPPIYLRKGVLVDYAAMAKKAVKIPIIAQGRIVDPDMAEAILEQGRADLIGLSRALLADPNWPMKAEKDKANEIRKCISCNHCIDQILKGRAIRCAINPTVGREGQLKEDFEKASVVKKIVVVGAGPAGMEAARVAAARGHHVKLFEKTDGLGGGQLKLAASAPKKNDIWKNITDFYRSQFAKMKNMKVITDREVDSELIKTESPDVVFVATGAKMSDCILPGADGKNCISARDVISGRTKVKGSILIAGGGLVGVDVAHLLAEQGANVTIIEAMPEIALDDDLITRLAVLEIFRKLDVKIITSAQIEAFDSKGALIRTEGGAQKHVEADRIVIALGTSSYNPFAGSGEETFDDCRLIGDAAVPGKIEDAITSAYFQAYRL